MSRPIVLVQDLTPDELRRVDELVRGQGRKLSALQAGRFVRDLAGVAALRCACGCGRVLDADRLARGIERRACLS